jgi:hypothetical protein
MIMARGVKPEKRGYILGWLRPVNKNKQQHDAKNNVEL